LWRPKITATKADLELLVAAQNQPQPSQPPHTTVTTEPIAPVSMAPINTPQYTMPEGYLWGMPLHYNMGYQPNASEFATHMVQNTVVIPQLGTTIP
jgi:hypothetical protein